MNHVLTWYPPILIATTPVQRNQRYVVRSDGQKQSQKIGETPTATSGGLSVDHLGEGCVAAFALTSALGQSEGPLSSAAGAFLDALGQDGGLVGALTATVVPVLPFLPRAAGDLVLYSAARGAIDLALDEGVIERFP